MLSAFKIRAIYLIMYMAFATWRVFYNVYLEDIGLKGSEIGALNSLIQTTIFFVVTWWGLFADKKGIRPAMRYAVIGTSILIFFLAYIHSFWILLLYLPLLSVFYHPLGPLNDAMAIQFAEVEGKHSYGSYRLWGSLGWAIAAILGGIIFTKIPLKYIFPVSSVLFLLTIPYLTTRKRKRVFRPNFEKLNLKELLQNKPLLLFFGILILYGLTCSPVNSYLNLYFKELKASNTIIGAAYAIMAFSELPFFLLGNYILKKFGAKQVILIAMISMILRFIIYGFYPSIAIALSVGILQGVSLAFFLVGSVSFLQGLMPAGRHAMAQSLIWGGFVGVGPMISNLLIGFLIDLAGMVGVMKIYIGVALICIWLTAAFFKRYNTASAG